MCTTYPFTVLGEKEGENHWIFLEVKGPQQDIAEAKEGDTLKRDNW